MVFIEEQLFLNKKAHIVLNETTTSIQALYDIKRISGL